MRRADYRLNHRVALASNRKSSIREIRIRRTGPGSCGPRSSPRPWRCRAPRLAPTLSVWRATFRVAGPLQVLEVVLVPSTMEPYATQQLKLDFPEGHPRQPRSNSI